MTNKTISLRVPDDLHKQIEILAKKDVRSTNQQYIWILQTFLKQLEYLEDEEDIRDAEEALKRNDFVSLKEAKKLLKLH